MDLVEPNTGKAPPSGEVLQVVEHLFREEAGKMVSILTRIFGIEHLNLAEDVVQEALARALQTWPYYGVPKNPSAWIMRVSRNLALDVVRREKVFRNKQDQIISSIDPGSADPDVPIFSEHEISDDRLRMIFVCCHPLLSPDVQVALALKTLCGFSIEEIGRAFLTNEAAIAKRLTRAKQKVREAKIAFEIPSGKELAGRLDGVLQTLYLLFNEGYKASNGETLIREELCREAIRLTTLLTQHQAGNQPRAHALLALMLLNAARFPTRVDTDGNLLRLKEQDRSRWDQSLIARGLFHLAQSAAGQELSAYHLQAGIAANHCAARDYESTDWQQIRLLYDQLIEFDDSPIVALNRAVAISEVDGPEAGLEALADVRRRKDLAGYHLLHAVLGELEARRNDHEAAAEHFRTSIELADLKSERAFLLKRLKDVETNGAPRRSSRPERRETQLQSAE